MGFTYKSMGRHRVKFPVKVLMVYLVAFPWATMLFGLPSVCVGTDISQPSSFLNKGYDSLELLSSTRTPLPSPSPPPLGFANPAWDQMYGGDDNDYSRSLVECVGGGFAIVGQTKSYGEGDWDILLIRTDSAGIILWNKTFGGSISDFGTDVLECSGGGFAIAGYTNSYGVGYFDVWLIRTDENGNHLWNQTYGTTNSEYAYSLVEHSSGGFALVGHIYGYGAGNADCWMIRTDDSGNQLWNETYGGVSHDQGDSVVECSDGGFFITGSTYSFSVGYDDIWLVRTDSNGNHIWNSSFGGTNHDQGYRGVECSTGGFAVAGKKNIGIGNGDFWLIRVDAGGNHLWNKLFGYYEMDHCSSMVECVDGGFALIGTTSSFSGGANIWLVRTNSNGNLTWSKLYGGSTGDHGSELVECADGGFALVGHTYKTPSNADIRLLRVFEMNWVETPVNQYREFGFGFTYDLNATSVMDLDTWTINDTAHFTINSEGVIANITYLGPAGTIYGLYVQVNDTLNNILSVNFTLSVLDTISPFWITQPMDQILRFGEALGYQLCASDLAGIVFWEVSDATNFAIDTTGFLTSNGILNPGTYEIKITIYDPSSNRQSATINIIVMQSVASLPVILALVGCIVICFIAFVLVVFLPRRHES